jgi:spore germination protein GerM
MIILRDYFANDKLDPNVTCEKVFPVERQVAKTDAIAKAALEELLKGVTEKEKANGYRSTINAGVKINKLTIVNGIAKVDFSETMGEAVGGSCKVNFIRKQIEQTLKQFSTVKSVVISINGDLEYILQP